MRVPAQNAARAFEVASAVVPDAAGGDCTQMLLRNRQPVGRGKRRRERIQSQVAREEPWSAGDLDEVIDRPLIGALHKHRAGGTIHIAHMRWKPVHLEGKLRRHDVSNLIGQLGRELLATEEERDTRSPPVVGGAGRVEAEYF